MKLFALSVLLFVSGCQKSSAPIPPVDALSVRSPTATEVFNRSSVWRRSPGSGAGRTAARVRPV